MRAIRPVPTLALALSTLGGSGPGASEGTLARATAAPVVTLSVTSIVGGNGLSATVTLVAAAPTAGTPVTFSTSPSALATLTDPATKSQVATLQVTVPAGQRTATVAVNTSGVAVQSPVTITASERTGAAGATLTVLPAGILTVRYSASTVVGGQGITATVIFDGEAPAAGGGTMALAVSGGSVGTPSLTPTVPASVPVPARARSVQVPIATVPQAVTSSYALVPTPSWSQVALRTPRFQVRVPEVSALTVPPVLGGNTATGTVALEAPAGPGGRVVNLGIGTLSPSASVPATVTVPQGARQVPVPVTTSLVPDDVFVRVTATAAATGATTTVSDGTSNTLIFAETGTATPVTVTASLAIRAYRVQAVTLDQPSTFGGAGTRTVTFVVNGAAPPGGLPIAPRSSSADASVPASVTVPPGRDRVGVPVTTRIVSVAGTASISVSPATTTSGGITDGTSNTVLVGESTAPLATLQLLPIPRLTAMAVAPTSVEGGSPFAVTLSFDPGALPPLSAPLPTIAATLARTPGSFVVLPAGVAVTAGQSSLQVQGTTSIVESDQVSQLSATLAGTTRSATLQVRRLPPILASLSLRQASVKGGNAATLLVELVATATAPATVALTSSRPDLVAVLASVVAQPGRQATAFSLQTSAVAQPTTVTITATSGSDRLTTTLTLQP